MTEKLMHVSCLVRDGNLWELLRSLEEHKVGNVEVRPVAPQLLALPAPDGKKRTKKGRGYRPPPLSRGSWTHVSPSQKLNGGL